MISRRDDAMRLDIGDAEAIRRPPGHRFSLSWPIDIGHELFTYISHGDTHHANLSIFGRRRRDAVAAAISCSPVMLSPSTGKWYR